ncbi:glycosyltransferase family 4 protein [Cupriavidus sp.]|uniref:glycosyltransferase family 4 protein n=1 Tax=Cupriavidus sp. TaxID=1873897 RepID=UPI0028BEB9D1|nr:glycosyltransferase family 4 protein [Cupriavidus sp.]
MADGAVTRRPVICFLTGTLNALAGAERVTASIASALAARGYRIHVLSLWDEASAFPLHPAVTHRALFPVRPSFKRQYAAIVWRIRRFMLTHDIDVLVEVDPMLTLFTLPALFGSRVRRVAWEHCHFDEDLGKPARRVARRLAARTAAAVVVLTDADRLRWRAAIRHPFQIAVIANPLPFDLPPRMEAPMQAKRVLAVGRLVEAKGFDILLEAWALVVREAPDWRLEIVGEGPARPALEALAAQYGVSKTVSMPGERTDIASAYRQAGVFCLSSRYEGFGLVLLEAMAFGLPVVASACEAGPKALLVEGGNAVMVPPEDGPVLARALLRVIGDPDLRWQLAKGGRLTAAAHTVDRLVDQEWEALLRGVVTGNGGAAPSE